MKFISIILFLFLTLSCNNNVKEEQPYNLPYSLIEDKVNYLITNDKSILTSLTNSYGFKLFENGVGIDTTKSYFCDTIIILKNEITQNLNLNSIYNGKALLLDSVSICKLSHDYDEKRQVMRHFIELRIYNETDKEIEMELKSNNLVPQFTGKNKHCVEVFKIDWVNKFTISK